MILIILYVVGFIGISLDFSRDLVLPFTALNLLLTAVIMLILFRIKEKKHVWASILVCLIGFIVEWIGVKTGLLFGTYWYGNTLGLKLDGIPLIIGVNWLILSISTYGITKQLTKLVWVNQVLAALLMVFLDFFIEPIAIQLDFWHWENEFIPLQNYFMWFIVAFGIQMLLSQFKFPSKKRVCWLIYGVQFAFFVGLNLIIR